MTQHTARASRVPDSSRATWRVAAFASSLLCVLLLSGCAQFFHGSDPAAPVKDLRAAYILAVDSYLAGQYEKAVSIFQRLSGNTLDPVLARKAYYGLACARLATAKTPAELREALSIWNTWVQMTPEGLPSEDPRLVTPLLPRLTPSGSSTESPPLLTEEEISKELANTKRLAGCQEETGKVKESLRKKTAEAEALRSQLNALDRLHQEISMKKKGLE